MVIETIIIGFVGIVITIIMCFGGIIGISTYKSISLGLAQISESGKNTRERINVRADLAYGDDGEQREADETEPNQLDGIARMLGYDSLSSAISDPKLIGMLTGKNKQENN